MHVLIPFLSLKLKNGRRVWIDAYFSKKLEKSFRIASLIRSDVDIFTEETDENDVVKLEPILSFPELKQIIAKILEEIDSKLNLIKSERGKHYAKWNLLRLLFIPFGWSRKIKEDEVRSSIQRELTYSKEILKAISSSSSGGEIEYFVMEVENGKPKDKVYRKLYEMDSGFKKSLDEMVNSL